MDGINSDYITVHELNQDGLQDPKLISIEGFLNGGLERFRGNDEIKLSCGEAEASMLTDVGASKEARKIEEKNIEFEDDVAQMSQVNNPKQQPLLTLLAAKQTTYFQSFSSAREVGELSSEHLHGHQELALVLEIADIIDELNMMRHLIQKQREVLKSLILAMRILNPASDSKTDRTGVMFSINEPVISGNGAINVLTNHHDGLTDLADSIKILAQGISGRSRDIVISTDDDLLAIYTELKIMKEDAEYNHKMTAAALAEARSTTQQGRAIMLFTIVTIVFLPLSFFTSYFGQNIFEITGDENNPHAWDLWRYGIVILAPLLAYCTVKPCWSLRRTRRNSSA
ncbi:uncharacterized protein FTJAE_7895 [Fusarium tjaetaba]|uniref:Uncharacterized protein n=1 Tax=Fusarium tjaetaba TaxID=1567544 RepID=A0A8H5VR08_9HYPO|nr:uncharacterized protein FTJAE_7895 [Fusarium tjaetaba]KAF5631385.1 hypothetical protein FTJAE_7895 [Fusarium tjaetaba]